jgi:hypothetical protein
LWPSRGYSPHRTAGPVEVSRGPTLTLICPLLPHEDPVSVDLGPPRVGASHKTEMRVDTDFR